MLSRRSWTLLAGASLIACSSTNSGGPSPGDAAPGVTESLDGASSDGQSTATQTVTQIVGTSGGTVSAGGMALTIPAGALPADTTITVTVGGGQVPSAYTGLSPIYTLGPAGTVLSQPATVAISLTTTGPGATVFWSNATGGYDPLTTTATASGVSASIVRLGDGFAGLLRVQDAGLDATTGSGSDSGSSGSGSDAGTPAESGAVDDGSTPAESGATDGGAVATYDAASADGAASTDGAASDAGTPGIFVSVAGTQTAFVFNTTVTLNQAWWVITGDDSPSPTHWTMKLVVPTNAGTLSCGGAFPSINYVHYTAGSGDAGTADTTYASNITGSSCTIDETTTATTAGQHATGTFSGTLVQSSDAGGPATETLTGGTYDVVVP